MKFHLPLFINHQSVAILSLNPIPYGGGGQYDPPTFFCSHFFSFKLSLVNFYDFVVRARTRFLKKKIAGLG